METAAKPSTLRELRERDRQAGNPRQLPRMLAAGEELFPGIVGYDDTVIPEINIACSPGTTCCSWARRGRPRAG
jgi:magnesium chelatase subunit I